MTAAAVVDKLNLTRLREFVVGNVIRARPACDIIRSTVRRLLLLFCERRTWRRAVLVICCARMKKKLCEIKNDCQGDKKKKTKMH